jgi:hypothetical protein
MVNLFIRVTGLMEKTQIFLLKLNHMINSMSKFSHRPNPHLYEINTVAWLYEVSQKLGRNILLGDVPAEEWDKLNKLGMDFVWLMGVWRRSKAGRDLTLHDPVFHKIFDEALPDWTEKDVVGSSYSISSHEPDPLIGTWKDIDNTRRELNRRGMGLIVDFIPNHTGIDHHWLREHPEYYIQVTEEDYNKDRSAFLPLRSETKTLYIARARDPNFPPWTDTAQLNYLNPDTREAVLLKLEEVARHCDGVRCDMAMLLLNDVFRRTWGWTQKDSGEVSLEEFWSQATRRVPGLIWIAEAYWDTEWTLQQLGFDYVYDKRLYDRMENSSPREVRLHLTAGLDYQNKLLRFIENHDESRSPSAFGKEQIPAVSTLFSTVPGMKLFFHGQFEGIKLRLPLQLRRTINETPDPEIRAFYDKLMPIINQDIFHRGEWKLLEVNPQQGSADEAVIALSWRQEEHVKLVVVNLSQGAISYRIRLPDLKSKNNYLLVDDFTGQSTRMPATDLVSAGLPVELGGYQTRIVDIS